MARYLPDIDDTQIRAIFGRLNRNNVVLNSQELRQATYWGPFINTMNEIAEYENWGKLDIFTSNDIKRMLDVEFVSELAIAILNGHQNKKLTIEKYYQLYEKEFEQRNYIKELFDSIDQTQYSTEEFHEILEVFVQSTHSSEIFPRLFSINKISN